MLRDRRPLAVDRRVAKRASVLGALLAAVSLAVLTPAGQADEVACGTVITTSTTIGNNITGCAGDGIVIGAGGITVDLGGHSIEGTGLGVGVRNDGYDNVTIRNGTVRQFDYGIKLGPGTLRNAVTGIALAETEWSAVHLDDADGNQVLHSRASGFSDVGMHLVNGSSGNLVADNTVANGNGESFVLEHGSNQNRLRANVVEASSDTSVRVDDSADTRLVANRITGGSDAAISMTAAPGSIVQSNTVTDVGDAAILLSEATRNVVRFNQLGNSADAGIILSTVSDSLVKANTMSHTGDAAIILRAGSNGNRVIDNQGHHGSDAGIFVGDGESNLLRGNTVLNNAIGIELSGGKLNRLEFNVAKSNLGNGVEISESAGNTVFGNTMSENHQAGIWVEPVEGVASENRIIGNAANSNGDVGMSINDVGAIVTGNLARGNQGWGIYAVEGQVEGSSIKVRAADGGGNGASANAESAQCYLIPCSDGAGWQAPVRPPEPLDPLEGGLEARARAPKPRRSRLAVVTCKRHRRAGGRKAGRKARTTCRVSYRARPGSRRVTGRLVRDDAYVASGGRKVRGGSRGMLALRAHTRPRCGRCLLVLTFKDARSRVTVVRKVVRVR